MESNRCTYIGRTVGDKQRFNGKCRVYYDDGDVFEGLIRDNVFVVGEFSWAGGDVYRGELAVVANASGNDGEEGSKLCMHGQGEYHYVDGRVYRGAFREGRKNGLGEFLFERDTIDTVNGAVYRGFFKNDSREGYGEQTFTDGRRFVGNWLCNCVSGFGRMTYSDGSAHWGQFRTWLEREMLCDGVAIYVQGDGCRIREVWKNGKVAHANPLRRRREEAMAILQRTEPPVWIEDSASSNCFVCNAAFNVVVRRRHCRSCGDLICSDCLKRIELPFSKNKQSKVCEDCYILRKVTMSKPEAFSEKLNIPNV